MKDGRKEGRKAGEEKEAQDKAFALPFPAYCTISEYVCCWNRLPKKCNLTANCETLAGRVQPVICI